MHNNEYPRVMTLKQASSYLSISKSHLSNVINRKVLGVPTMQVARIGRRVVIKREWADEWLENAQQEALQ
jgi:excisionase family DNA binding protein